MPITIAQGETPLAFAVREVLNQERTIGALQHELSAYKDELNARQNLLNFNASKLAQARTEAWFTTGAAALISFVIGFLVCLLCEYFRGY
jgi:hypothetical protein